MTTVGAGAAPPLRSTVLWRVATAAVAVLVFGFSWFLRYNDPNGSFAGLTDDHFFYVVRGWQILFGDLPVRDFVDHGAPGYFLISAAVQELLGRGTTSELLFSTTALSLGAALTFWLAARASGSIGFGLFGAVFHLFLDPRFYNYPKILVYALAIPAIWAYADRPNTLRALLVALVTVFGFLLRHDHGVFVGLGMLTILLAMRQVPFAARARRALVYAALVIALLAPYLVYVQVNGGLIPYFRTAAAWAERDRGRAEVVWPGLFDNPDGVSDAARVGSGLTRIRATYYDNHTAWLYYTLLALPPLCLVALAFGREAFRPDWAHATPRLLVVIVLGAALNAFFLRQPLAARLADPSVPHAILVAWLGAAVWRSWRGRGLLRPGWQRRPLFARLALTVAAAPVLLVVAGLISDDTYRRLDKSSLVDGIDRAIERAGEITAATRAAWPIDPSIPHEGSMKLAAYIRACTAPSDRVLVTPYLPQVLAMADRAFAGGHADLRAGFFGTDEEQAQTIARLRRQSVPLVVFNEGELAGFREGFPLIAQYLDGHYDAAGTRPLDERTSIALLVRNDLIPRRTWPALDWPCFR
jgi:hypothetical protein